VSAFSPEDSFRQSCIVNDSVTLSPTRPQLYCECLLNSLLHAHSFIVTALWHSRLHGHSFIVTDLWHSRLHSHSLSWLLCDTLAYTATAVLWMSFWLSRPYDQYNKNEVCCMEHPTLELHMFCGNTFNFSSTFHSSWHLPCYVYFNACVSGLRRTSLFRGTSCLDMSLAKSYVVLLSWDLMRLTDLSDSKCLWQM
jgi:hypothetical protein